MSPRTLTVIAFASFSLSCAHAELVHGPGITDPGAPHNEAGLGLVRYPTDGSRSDQRQLRTDAYLEMHDACGGEPEVVRESSDLPGWHYLHFRCVGPGLPRPSEMPDEQKSCCWSMGRPCSDLTCSCNPERCPVE